MFTSHVLGAPNASDRRIPSPAGPAANLAIMWLVATDTPEAAHHVRITDEPGGNEGRLVYADDAVLYAAAFSAVGTGLERTAYGRRAVLHTIIETLRRFIAIMRELNKRHNGRTPLADIKDEYDVQDLLRGVLSVLGPRR